MSENTILNPDPLHVACYLSERLHPVADSAMLDWMQKGYLGEEKMAFWKKGSEKDDAFSVSLERQVCGGVCPGCSGLFPGLCDVYSMK